MTRESKLKKDFREDLFLNSRRNVHLYNNIRKVSEKHYVIKVTKAHRFSDWLNDWQQNNES